MPLRMKMGLFVNDLPKWFKGAGWCGLGPWPLGLHVPSVGDPRNSPTVSFLEPLALRSWRTSWTGVGSQNEAECPWPHGDHLRAPWGFCHLLGPLNGFPDVGSAGADLPDRQKSARRWGGGWSVFLLMLAVDGDWVEALQRSPSGSCQAPRSGGGRSHGQLGLGGWSPGIRRPYPVRAAAALEGVLHPHNSTRFWRARGRGLGLQHSGFSALMFQSDPVSLRLLLREAAHKR